MAKRYVEQWKKVKAENLGLLFEAFGFSLLSMVRLQSK